MLIEQRNYLAARLFELHVEAAKQLEQLTLIKRTKYFEAAHPTLNQMYALIKSGEAKLRPSTKVKSDDIASFYNFDALKAECKREQALLEKPDEVSVTLKWGSTQEYFRMCYPEHVEDFKAIEASLIRLTDIAMLEDQLVIDSKIDLLMPLGVACYDQS